MFAHRHNCRWRLDLSMFGLHCISGYEAEGVKGTRFPILRMKTISWDPVERSEPVKIGRPPGGPSIFGDFAPATGSQENVYVPKMGKPPLGSTNSLTIAH
jgi:hypothetical protein